MTVVFWHVPKTAGTAITAALKAAAGDDFFAAGHRTYVQGKAMWDSQERSPRLWTNAFHFGFVRNPWDRYVALYLHKFGRPNRPEEVSVKGFRAWMTGAPAGIALTHTPGTMLDVGFDFLGRFEHLDMDMKILGELLGYDFSQPITMKNPTNRTNQQFTRDRTHWYDEATAEAVRSVSPWEIKHFGYKFR